MATKSEVAVLDVLYKNEACHQDMLDIMRSQRAYLGKNFSSTVPSGDLLTCERQRSAQQHVMDSDTREDRLDLLEPVIEDWHTLMCLFEVSILAILHNRADTDTVLQEHSCLVFIFMQVIWRKYFTDSSSDHGTLGQFFALPRRLPVAKKPKKDMNACTDAIFTVLKGHHLAFACKELGIDNIDSDLNHQIVRSTSDTEKKKFMVGLSMKAVENCTIITDTLLGKTMKESGDGKYNYARSLCHYASLALEFMMPGMRAMGIES